MELQDLVLESAHHEGMVSTTAQVKEAAYNGGYATLKCVKCTWQGDMVCVDADNAKYNIPFEETAYEVGSKGLIKAEALRCVGCDIRVKASLADGNIQVSRKDIQQETRKFVLEHYKPGDVVKCKVTVPCVHGVFVDVGNGVTGLITENRISYSYRGGRAMDFQTGDELRAIIQRFDGERIFLTLRETLGTWEENAAEINRGDVIPGIVSGFEAFGIFVELAPNLKGLLDPSETVKLNVGDLINVGVRVIDPEKCRVKLTWIDGANLNGPQKAKVNVSDWYRCRLGADVTHLDKWQYMQKVGKDGKIDVKCVDFTLGDQ